MSHKKSTASSILEVFSLNPLPYPVLLILALIFLFLGFQFYSQYEEAVESTETTMNWLLMATPFVLLFAVKLSSSIENPGRLFGYGLSPWEQHRRNNYIPTSSSEGSSPWGVAVLIVVLLVLLQYQSAFQESWFG